MVHLLFAGSGLLIALVGIPLWRRRIPPNHLYGVRTAGTLKDSTVWYETNAIGGLYCVMAGVVTMVVALTLVLVGVPPTLAAWIDLGVLLLSVLVVCVKSARVAASLARQSC